MNNVVDEQMSNEKEIDSLLGMIDDNFKLYSEYSDEESYVEYFKEHNKELCDKINELIVKNMNCEIYINYYHIIGVYMYIKNNNPEFSSKQIVEKMFDKTNTKTKIKMFNSKIIS